MKEARHKSHMLYDCICVKYQEQASPETESSMAAARGWQGAKRARAGSQDCLIGLGWLDRGNSFPRGARGQEPVCQCRRHKRWGFDPWVGKIPWRRKWQPTPVFLPGKPHGQKSPAGYSPQGHTETWLKQLSTFTDRCNRCTTLWMYKMPVNSML